MAKIYYHTQAGATGKFVIWSHASSLTEAGKTLAKHNRIWPDSFGDKLVKISDFFLTDGWIRS